MKELYPQLLKKDQNQQCVYIQCQIKQN